MIHFEDTDVTPLFQLPKYDINKLHVRILYEVAYVADCLTSIGIGLETSRIKIQSIKLECMIYAYSYSLYKLMLLGGEANRMYVDECKSIFKGFMLHSLDSKLATLFMEHSSSPLHFCERRFDLYSKLLGAQTDYSFEMDKLLLTLFYKQTLVNLLLNDIQDDENFQNQINSIIVQDDSLQTRFSPKIKQYKTYLEDKVEEFMIDIIETQR